MTINWGKHEQNVQSDAPGEVLRDWLPEQITVTQAAKELQVSRVTLSKYVKILFR